MSDHCAGCPFVKDCPDCQNRGSEAVVAQEISPVLWDNESGPEVRQHPEARPTHPITAEGDQGSW